MEALGINLGMLVVQILVFTIVMLTLNAWVFQSATVMGDHLQMRGDAKSNSNPRSSAFICGPSAFIRVLFAGRYCFSLPAGLARKSPALIITSFFGS